VGWQKVVVAPAKKDRAYPVRGAPLDGVFDANHLPEPPAPHCAPSQRSAL
jgi:hypothetical protein